MADINIKSHSTDRLNNCKVPKLIAKVEGKGNGIKTVIVNMPEIAKSLNRPPMYPTKHFGCQLGAQVNFDNKSERYIVNGAHDLNKLQDLLDGFIQKYVLCKSCKSSETTLSVDKDEAIIVSKCRSCDYAGIIRSANDQVAAYILKNPPPKPAAPATAQRKYESTGQYLRRLDRLIAKAKVEASLETRFDMTLKAQKRKAPALDRDDSSDSRKRRRRKRY